MLMGWNALTGFATLVFLVLSFIAHPHLRRRMRAGAVASGLLFASLLAGPPFDAVACVFLLALVVCLDFFAFREML